MASGGGFGFLRASKGRQAEDVIARCESLITVLQLKQIDLSSAEALVTAAKKAFRCQDYVQASGAALLAERIALKLEEQYIAYEKALDSVQARIEELQRYGIPAEDLEEEVRRAGERVSAGAWEESFKIPDYGSARGILVKAERNGKVLVERAASASNAVFMAELAIEALVGVPGPNDRDVFEKGGAEALLNALEGATRRLALRDYDQATRVAKDIEARANRLRAEFIEATETLTATSVLLGELREKGMSIGRLGSQVAIARGVLHRGVIDPAAGMVRRLLDDARSLHDNFTRATQGVAAATNRYAALVREGHLSPPADRAILDARRALRDGDYALAIQHLDEANGAISRREAERQALAKSIEAHRHGTVSKSAPFFPDAQEILVRAQKEFADGDYASSHEDLVLATLLLGPVSPKAKRAKG